MKFSYAKSCVFTRLTFLIFLFFSITLQSQVGIGNTNPDVSSMLDIASTSKGLLVPRMTTAQRIAITTPANSLLVYDTTLKSYYYYDTTILPAPGNWVKINSGSDQRNNYKLVKSAADFPAVVGGKITLLSNTFYEINGTVAITAPIDLNDAYVAGLDANEDVLSFAGGTVFSGSTGGSIRNITIKGARAFNIAGPGIYSSTSLIVQNTVIDGMTTSVGSISGIGLYFGNIIQFINNINGITYSNIGNLLLSNQAWLSSNLGTYETFTGAFGLIEKVSGFSTTNGTAVAIDVSSNPTLGSGVIIATVFSGNTTAPGGYIKRYTTGSYVGFNFTNIWSVQCPGIPEEMDATATGNIYVTGTPLTTTFSSSGSTGRKKLLMTTTATEMFRTASAVDNRITYMGSKTRKFNIAASFSVDAVSSNKFFTFYIAKNGVIIPATAISTKVVGGGDVRALSFTGTTTMVPGEYIEVWAQNDSDTSGLIIPALNLLIN